MQREEEGGMRSDHSSIVVIFSEDIIKKENNSTLVNELSDRKIFKICLERNINRSVSMRNEHQLEEEIKKFVNNMHQAAWQNTREIKLRIN